MDKNNLFDIIVVEWIASLKSKDRSRKYVRPNFEEVFDKLKVAGATFDDIYETLLPKILKAHYPVPSKARETYKSLKSTIRTFDKSEKEFIEEWNAGIDATGTETFFEFFPATTADHDSEPKVYGNMSATEYRAQRRYADQFPILSTDELIKQWKQQVEFNLDIESTLENILGEDKNETNQ